MLPELKTYADLAYANLDTIQNTYDLTCRAIRECPPYAALVECGVAAGAQLGVMVHACRDCGVGVGRQIIGFDSFEGIPLAGAKDDEQPGIGPVDPNRVLPDDPRELLKSSGITVHGEDVVWDNLIGRWGCEPERLRLIKGWFQDTVREAVAAGKVGPIALLRLDGDLYESTKVCLEHLHPLVVKNGFVIVDDYALTGARRAVQEYFEAHGLSYPLIPVDPEKPEVHWYQVTKQPAIVVQPFTR